MAIGNQLIQQRLDDLIGEGERLLSDHEKRGNASLKNAVPFSLWITSCLNLLHKLSISTNRFAVLFERCVPLSASGSVNLGVALGVLKSARVEYSLGLAVEYHLSVSAAVFDGILDEADYLLSKGYQRAAAVLMEAALEESLKTRARAIGLEVGPKDTLTPVITKLKAPDVQALNEFEAKRLESLAKMRNVAAHGGEFDYQAEQVRQALAEVRSTLEQMLRHA